jgi:hypothetical protein
MGALDDIRDARRRRTKDEIRRQLKRFLRSAREKELLVLSGFAREFCRVHDLQPEQIELVRRDVSHQDTVFFFRKREGALIIPGGRQ